MATTYAEAGPQIQAQIKSALKEHHPDLCQVGVTIHCLIIDRINKDGENLPALKNHGYPAAAKISVTATADRARGVPDAKLVIDRYQWERIAAGRRVALLDHELEHLVPVMYRDTKKNRENGVVGTVKTDDQGRPCLRIKAHDWEGGFFEAVIKRHGEASPEAHQARVWQESWGQYCLFEMPDNDDKKRAKR